MHMKDYHHRKFTINFYIYLNQWLEFNNGHLIFLNYYFDKSGNNRSNEKSKYVTALNRINLNDMRSFIPDINTRFSLDGEEYIYLFEQHNGKDTKRLFEQLHTHIVAIAEGVVSKKYNLQKVHKVVVVCEYESVKTSVIQRLKEESNIEYYNNFFIFKTNSELEEDFSNNWTLINGEQVSFLPNP